MDSILEKKVAFAEADSGAYVTFPLKEFDVGGYTIYGIGTAGASFTVPLPFVVDDKAGIPEISVEEDTVIQGEKFIFQCDKSGTLYLANPGTTPENIHQTSRIKASAEVTAGVPVEIETADLYPKTYVALVKDLFGFFSEPMLVNVMLDPTSIPGPAVSVSRIYPNPTEKFLNIELESAGPYQVDIHSLAGKLLSRTQVEGTSHQLDLSSFRSGVYFLTIRSGDFVTTRKIIKL